MDFLNDFVFQEDQRRYERYAVAIKACFDYNGRTHACEVRNLGTGGVLIEASVRVEPGERLTLNIETGSRVNFEGTVRHVSSTDSVHRIGIQFNGSEEELQALVDRIIKVCIWSMDESS